MKISIMRKLSLLTLIFVLVGACALLFASCAKEEPTESVTLTYTEEDEVITITGYEGVLADGQTLTIPSAIDGKKVGAIAAAAFAEREDLTSVFVPASISAIGEGAFENCKNLKTVNIPIFVSVIEAKTFEGCESLEKVSLPASVTAIGERAFLGCKSLEELTITKNVTEIGEEAFDKCRIKKAEIPTWAISAINTKYLESIVITAGDKIESGLFKKSENIKNVYIPATVTEIAQDAFAACGGIENLTVSGWALDRFELGALKSLTIIGEAEIAKGMLAGLTELTSLTIPYIGSSATDAEYNHFGYIFGADDASANANYVPKSLTSVVITGGDKVAKEAFFGCSHLTSVILPASIKSIGERAFGDCARLASVNIPAKVTEIGAEAFAKTKIESATIPNGVTKVGEKVFYECSALKTLTIGSGVEAVGHEAFLGCDALEALYISDVEKWCNIAFDSYYNNPLFYAAKLYVKGEIIEELVIPESITEIGNNTFFRMTNVKRIVLHDGITKIGDYAFTSCTSLESIVIPEGVTSIGKSAFANCAALGEVTIPAGVISIGDYAFNLCSAIESVTVLGATEIGAYAFNGCEALSAIDVSAAVAVVGDGAFDGCENVKSASAPIAVLEGVSTRILSTIIINAGTEIGEGFFKGAEKLTNVTIADSVTAIGKEAFAGCTALREVGYAAGGGVITVGEAAFSGCNKLTGLVIPASVSAVADDAFTGCYSLVEVYNLSALDLTSALPYTYVINDSIDDASGYTEDGDFVFYEYDGVSYLVGYFGSRTGVTLPEGTYTINKYAFAGSDITSLTVPAGIAAIGEGAFAECAISALTATVSVLEHIDLTKLTSLTLVGESTLGATALEGCAELVSLTLPATLTTVEDGALANLAKLTAISVEAGSESFKTVDGSLYSLDGTVLYRAVSGTPYFTVPKGVTTIAPYAFAGLTELFSVTLDDAAIATIGAGAFKGCASISKIEIPATVTAIGAGAFEGCESLWSVGVADGNTVYSVQDGKLVETASGKVVWEKTEA